VRSQRYDSHYAFVWCTSWKVRKKCNQFLNLTSPIVTVAVRISEAYFSIRVFMLAEFWGGEWPSVIPLHTDKSVIGLRSHLITPVSVTLKLWIQWLSCNYAIPLKLARNPTLTKYIRTVNITKAYTRRSLWSNTSPPSNIIMVLNKIRL
jgi:hypothetical protein